MTPTAFLDQSLLLDLETRGSEAILRIGAVLRNLSFERKGSFRVERALIELDLLARSARWVLGHNLLDHDLPLIRQLAPSLELLRKPVIDTLVLSPLAFPENPYHRLVKDYRLVSGSVNDPVADARLAGQLFRDQLLSFTRLAARERELLAFYAFCLQPSGAADVLETIAGRPALTHPEAAAFFTQSCAVFACRRALAQLTLTDSAERPAWAYAVAWLRVSGANSVLPPWVWHRHPAVRALLHALREVPCDDPACSYCRSTHDPAAQLERFFGFREFRPEPRGEDGTSLQEAIIRTGLAGEPHLAILATGAGKSICYQLPALVRYFRRGSLTVVISPLQALMKDQVTNLNARTGTDCAAALYGLLTPPERGAVHERVRLGDVALLYVSPEQLRNRSFRSTIEQREIGCWVFDEAHCLSKWGHDFRPDYLYAARFIRQLAQRQGGPPPPVAAFTATAKLDVEREIVEHFERELGQRLRVFSSSVERPELRFRVEATLPAEKLERIASFLAEALAGPRGSAVVYFASRRGSERAARSLAQMGFPAGVFHAGLKAAEKREVLDAFLSGALRVVCATNAFGMGIDKDDVRLVIHAEIPGSLESYLQEAGRAGRDRLPSSCVLLFDEADVEKQFRLSASSRLSHRDVADLLRALRRTRKKHGSELVVTTGELLHDDTLGPGLDADDPFAETKVRTGIAWLERAGFIERGENHTRVFQGRLKVTSVEQARAKISGLHLADREREQWLAVVAALIAADPDRGLTADELAELPELGWVETPGDEDETPGERVLRLLHRMAEAGLLREGLVLTATLRARGRGNAPSTFETLCALERAMLEELRAAEPDAEPVDEDVSEGSWLELSLRLLNQRLLDRGLKSHPETLRRLLGSLARAGKRRAGRAGSLELAYRSRGHYRLRLLRSWGEIFELAELRRSTGRVLLDLMLARVPAHTGERVTVEFSSEELTTALRTDLALSTQLRDPLAAAERALLFLHEQGVIHLQGGLAVFRQAMGLRLVPEARGRRYGRSDYAPLDEHYGERTFQVHVMARYAHLGLEHVKTALKLVEDYFALARKAFLRRYFAGEEAEVARATGPESYRQIVDELASPAQIALVTASPERNLLVLAGPGSGKTRVVVHRAAYLLRVARVSPRSLLLLCFNRNAALELRRRLAELVGEDARGVTVLTYHGLAMRLTGTSFATLLEGGERKAPNFDELIPAAVELLTGKKEEAPGIEAEELRERLLAGYSHLLVDEYQDVNPPQYELLSAIAGRTREEGEGKLQILAVGDDDQNVYTFTGAHVRYIRQFQDDYQAEVHLLVENYRSTANVIACANQLIAHNRDRMKRDAPITIDTARRDEERGEPVEVLEVADAACQAAAVVARLERLREREPGLVWSRCAVLGRMHESLEPARALLEQAGIPVSLAPKASLPPLWRLREIARVLSLLREERQDLCRASDLEARCEPLAAAAPGNPWWRLLMEIFAELRVETNDARQPAAFALEFVLDALAERGRRAILGEGVRLLTAHAAKGLEFDHVLVVDGDWELMSRQSLEEERRLFYVAMTRARRTLCLFERDDSRNPHTALLAGDFLRRSRPEVEPPPAEIVGRRFELLGLDDVYLSYAGYFGPSSPIHRRLARLEPGDALELCSGEPRLRLVDRSGGAVALLSEKSSEKWLGRLDEVVSARVLGVIEQRAETASSEHGDRAQQPRWEVPIVELVWLGAPTFRPIRV